MTKVDEPADVIVFDGFKDMGRGKELKKLYDSLGLAMTFRDFQHIRIISKGKSTASRPSMTEVRVLDTYWSDHCRHTTFQQNLQKFPLETEIIENRWKILTSGTFAIAAGKRFLKGVRTNLYV